MKPACKDCVFWETKHITLDDKGRSFNVADPSQKAEHTAGYCRKGLPTAAGSVGGGFRVIPVTLGKDWCGHFDPGEPEPALISADPEPEKVETPRRSRSRPKAIDNPDAPT